ncbi:MAG: type VI secretion system contractile sheath small subunit, partial [Phycisphaerae bacterium]
RVEHPLQGDGSEMRVQLQFKSMEDIEPGAVVQQVEPLRKLLETRNKLRDLLAKADGSSELEEKLEEILKESDQAAKLAAELGLKKEGE